MTKNESRPGIPEAASLTKGDSTANCRRCGRRLSALRSVQREAGCICWRQLRAEAVTA